MGIFETWGCADGSVLAVAEGGVWQLGGRHTPTGGALQDYRLQELPVSSVVRGAVNTTFGQERTGSNLRSERSPHNQIMAVDWRAAQSGRCMKNLPAEENPHETRALARFAAVQAVEQARQAGLPLVHAIQQAAQQAWDGRIYAAATIEEWVYKYRRCKFGALQNRPRNDRGQHRTLEPTGPRGSDR
jgi:hypothetical protein